MRSQRPSIYIVAEFSRSGYSLAMCRRGMRSLRRVRASFGADPNLLPVLQQVDAIVLMSLYEAWPTVTLEAFEFGVPVLAYDCPSGPAEMIGVDERGWLTAEDPAALAEALVARLAREGDKEARRRSMAGRAYLERFAPPAALRAWRDVFDEVLAVGAAAKLKMTRVDSQPKSEPRR
jgi:glycosyltransferase involved in cell wall biosynthesis